jgi:hypothetical protein
MSAPNVTVNVANAYGSAPCTRKYGLPGSTSSSMRVVASVACSAATASSATPTAPPSRNASQRRRVTDCVHANWCVPNSNSRLTNGAPSSRARNRNRYGVKLTVMPLTRG